MNSNTLHTIEKLIERENDLYEPSYEDFLLTLSRAKLKINESEKSPYTHFLARHSMLLKGISSFAAFGILVFAVSRPVMVSAPMSEITRQTSKMDSVSTESDIFMQDLGGFADEVSFVDDQINSDNLIDIKYKKGSYNFRNNQFA